MMDKLRILLEYIRLEITFFLTVLVWHLNYRHGPDIGISEVLRAMADRFEPGHEYWNTATVN